MIAAGRGGQLVSASLGGRSGRTATGTPRTPRARPVSVGMSGCVSTCAAPHRRVGRGARRGQDPLVNTVEISGWTGRTPGQTLDRAVLRSRGRPPSAPPPSWPVSQEPVPDLHIARHPGVVCVRTSPGGPASSRCGRSTCCSPAHQARGCSWTGEPCSPDRARRPPSRRGDAA